MKRSFSSNGNMSGFVSIRKDGSSEWKKTPPLDLCAKAPPPVPPSVPSVPPVSLARRCSADSAQLCSRHSSSTAKAARAATGSARRRNIGRDAEGAATKAFGLFKGWAKKALWPRENWSEGVCLGTLTKTRLFFKSETRIFL